MQLLAFVVFLVVSQFVLMQMFRLTTYHRYFARAVPLLLGYAVLVGYLVVRLGLAQFWLWYVICATVWLATTWQKSARSGQVFDEAFADDPATAAVLRLSGASTRAYYWLSAIIYLVMYVVSCLYFFNIAARAAPPN